MAQPPRDGLSSQGGFSELDEELATARDALLLFADAERVLDSLVCDPSDPDCRYPDLATVRARATVDELLHLVAGLPEGAEDERGEEATSLYPTLLELAEVFDILIDQHSLVYGDAVALAESMEGGWHAMAGCFNHDPAPEEATRAVKQMSANLAALPAVLDSVGRLSPELRREAAGRSGRGAGSLWRMEARHLGAHAVDTWLPHGISDPRLQRALQPARAKAVSGSGTDPAAMLAAATADLLLARLVRGISRDLVTDALEASFEGLLHTG
jgi:hypothetical protein